jgi:DNA repair protein RadC
MTTAISIHRIQDLPASDRPRERLLERGPQSLSDSELLAVLLRVGGRSGNAVELSRRLLSECGGLYGLGSKTIEELCHLKDFGRGKATVLLAAIELGRRISSLNPNDRPILSSPEMVARLIQYEMSDLEQEHLRSILVDTRNRLIKIKEVYCGSLNMSVVRIGEVFREAIRCNAAGLVIAHNHPSGDPSPSSEDIRITNEFVCAGKLLDIRVLDHIIIGRGRFCSLREMGVGFFDSFTES